MDEQKIRQIIQDEIRRNDGHGRFSLQNIAHHTHNGIDSLPIVSPTIVYTGFVPYDTTIGGLEFFLPAGWTVATTGSGGYTITHNLGTLLYGFVATASQSTNEKALAVVNPDVNSVDVEWFNITGANVTTSFMFVLVQINNRKSSYPQYTAS